MGETKVILTVLIIALLSLSADAVSLWTDKDDYAPGETVHISGSGFDNFPIIGIRITRPDNSIHECPDPYWCPSQLPTTAFFTYPYNLNGIKGEYLVEATDGVNYAKTTFTDSVCNDYTDHSTCVSDDNCRWCSECAPTTPGFYAVNRCVEKTAGCVYTGCSAECGAACVSHTQCPNYCATEDGPAVMWGSCDFGSCTCSYNKMPCLQNQNNPCLDDVCVSGVCTYSYTTNTCNDNNLCTVDDVCSNGLCSGTQKNCDDSDVCTADSCDPATGDCVHTNIQGCCYTSADCDDNNLCTDDVCNTQNQCVNTNNNDDCGTCAKCSSGSCIADLTQDDDCGFCEKCTDKFTCGYQSTTEDVKNECALEDCSTGFCDGEGSCDLRPSNYVCREKAGVCDIEDKCTGSSADCPADAKSNSECRASSGICDLPEVCDGVNNDCPTDLVRSSSYICRDSGACNPAEYCDGSSKQCPVDLKSPDGTDCPGTPGKCCSGICDNDGISNTDYHADCRSGPQCISPGSWGYISINEGSLCGGYNCRECKLGLCNNDEDSRCTGDCDYCDGNCVPDESICEELYCSDCTGSGTSFSCTYDQTENSDCNEFDITGVESCDHNPDNIHYTFDYRSEFDSVCSAMNVCSQGQNLIAHTCADNDLSDSVPLGGCDAMCDENSDCSITECDHLDGCYEGQYRDYHDIHNNCLESCFCENNACTEYDATEPDSDNDGSDDPCDLCPNSRAGEIIDQNGCDPFQFCEPYYCSMGCYNADFIPLHGSPENTAYPSDCTVVILIRSGYGQTPKCVPTTCCN